MRTTSTAGRVRAEEHVDRLLPVGRLPGHHHVGGRVEDHREPGAHQLLVVDEEHPHPVSVTSTLRRPARAAASPLPHTRPACRGPATSVTAGRDDALAHTGQSAARSVGRRGPAEPVVGHGDPQPARHPLDEHLAAGVGARRA